MMKSNIIISHQNCVQEEWLVAEEMTYIGLFPLSHKHFKHKSRTSGPDTQTTWEWTTHQAERQRERMRRRKEKEENEKEEREGETKWEKEVINKKWRG